MVVKHILEGGGPDLLSGVEIIVEKMENQRCRLLLLILLG
jgi:hypothetical protein